MMELNDYREYEPRFVKRPLNDQFKLTNKLDLNNNLDDKLNCSLKRLKANNNTIISIDNLNKRSVDLKENLNLNQQRQAQFSSVTMLNGGSMMLANNLLNGNQINGDVSTPASTFSPNLNLTGNGNSNTISGLSPSSSYDSFSPRCKCF